MKYFKKLALTGIGLAFVLGLAVSESSAQRRGGYYGNRGYTRSYVVYQPTYSSYYGNRWSGRSYNRGRYGLSWRERRRLRWQRYRMIRATRRYYRTRARILNRRAYSHNRRYFRNY